MLQSQVNKEVLDLTIIGYSIAVVLLLAVAFILFFLAFQKRKNKLLMEKLEQQKRFDEELIIAQQEIQDETLKQVGRELHDNIGQLLALTSMHLKVAQSKAGETVKKSLGNASESLKTSLEEVRALSKSLNGDVIINLPFRDSLIAEIERLRKLGAITIEFSQIGEHRQLNKPEHRLMLFRIIQEFISNSLKYSEAETISISLNYYSQKLQIQIQDDGIGFDMRTITKGSGLINMEKRANLINADYNLSSQLKIGTTITIQYPLT